MRTIQQTIQITYRYPVHFTHGLFAPENPLLAEVLCDEAAGEPKKLLYVVDRGLLRRHPGLLAAIEEYCRRYSDALVLAGPPLLIEGGEGVKNDHTNVAAILGAIHACGIDRHSYVLAIGGGAVLDMAGYAAATAHRGVRLIRVPTTVLAQNDSGVGVKNSVNAFGKKNFLGTFAPPYAVLNDSDFLTTLADRDWRSGIAEAIKVALLKDQAFFTFIEAHAAALVRRDMPAMQWLIYRCAQLHLEHIATSGDPFEFGSARPLDFGHWAAHKLEQLTDYGLRHGEAVAIGLALDSTYAYLAGLLPEGDWQRILQTITSLGLPMYVRELSLHLYDRSSTGCVLAGLNEFREHLGGQLTITLLERIGAGIEVHAIDEALMVRSIALLENHHAVQQQGGMLCRPIAALAR
jgi:3-dehydroquinate synthase